MEQDINQNDPSHKTVRVVRLSGNNSRTEIVAYGPWFDGKATAVGAILKGNINLHIPTLEHIGVSPDQIMDDLQALKSETGHQFEDREYQPYDGRGTRYGKVKIE